MKKGTVILVLVGLIISGLGMPTKQEAVGYSIFCVLSISGTTILPTGSIIFINLHRFNQECRFWELYGQSKSAVFRPNWADLNTFLAAFEVENGIYLIEIVECGGQRYYRETEIKSDDKSVFLDIVKERRLPVIIMDAKEGLFWLFFFNLVV